MTGIPSFGGATGWLNTAPLTLRDLRGRVVLVNFWTYTCINWLRQLPYVRAWAAKYADAGLSVIGVHTPEFGFEHDVDNVRRAVKEMQPPTHQEHLLRSSRVRHPKIVCSSLGGHPSADIDLQPIKRAGQRRPAGDHR